MINLAGHSRQVNVNTEDCEEFFLELEYKMEMSVRSKVTRKGVKRDFLDRMVVVETND